MPVSHRLCLVLFSLIIALSPGAAHAALQISSPDFADGRPMPAKYAKAHGNTSPALRLKGIPEDAKSLLLIVEDPDAPKPKFTHWLVWNIDPHHALFLEGRPPRGSLVGTNTMGDTHYDGPAPPPGKAHRYYFRLYALDQPLTLAASADRDAVEKQMAGHVITSASVMGTYQINP